MIHKIAAYIIGLGALLMLFCILTELQVINTSTHDSKIELEKIRMGMR